MSSTVSTVLLLLYVHVFATLVQGVLSSAPACSATLTPANSIKPTVASGYRMALVATGLTKPRSIEFDSSGNLLVVQQGAGIINLAFKDEGSTCLSVMSSKNVVENSNVCHIPAYCI